MNKQSTEPEEEFALKKRRSGKKSWREPFLKMLAKSGNVLLACQSSAVTRSSAYKEKSLNRAFSAQWDEAMAKAVDFLEATAWKRATTGTMEPVWMKDEHGRPVKVDSVPRMSDTLLIFLLKAHRPQMYRETFRSEVSGPGGSPLVSMAMQVDLPAIRTRVASAIEAQQKVDAMIERGLICAPGEDPEQPIVGSNVRDENSKSTEPFDSEG